LNFWSLCSEGLWPLSQSEAEPLGAIRIPGASELPSKGKRRRRVRELRSPRVNDRLRDTTGRPAVTSRKEGEVLVRKRKRGRVYALRF